MANSKFINQFILRFQQQFNPFHKDLSAVILTPDNHLWLGSDETTSLDRLSFDGSQAFSNHQHINIGKFIELPDAEDEEIDIEGLAYADYYLWFVGSHSWKRKQPEKDKTDKKNSERLANVDLEKNRFILGRIPLVKGELFQSCPHPEHQDNPLTAAKLQLTDNGNLLIDALESDEHLKPFILAGIPGKDNGFDIEGLAISNNRIFLGLRGPVLRGWAIVLEVEVQATSPKSLELKELGDNGKLYKKHFVRLGGLGIRELCFDGQDLLILAGPTMDIDGPVKVFRLQNGFNSDNLFSWEPQPILDLPYGEGNDHAEGITLFNAIAQQPSILVVYDSPSPRRILDEAAAVMADAFSLG